MTKSILSAKTEPRENLFLNLIFNFGLPIMILRKGNDWVGDSLIQWLEVPTESKLVPSLLLGLALLFPFSYGIYDLLKRKKWNLFSILGIISILLTGGIGLIPGGTVNMFAIKETAIPAIIGLITLTTLRTKKPLVELLLYNPQIFDVEKIEKELKIRSTKSAFKKLLTKCTWLLALSFLLSAVLNYYLSKAIVVTEPFVDANAFNDEIGEMMTWSYLVIIAPCMLVSGYALWILVKGIKALTGLNMESAIRQTETSSPSD
jgi:hypothetical protein